MTQHNAHVADGHDSIPVLKNYIGGSWVSGNGDENTSINPADASVCHRFTNASPEQLEQAIASAKSARSDWDRLGVIARGAILRKAAQLMEERAEELAQLMTLEQGKVLGDSRGEVGATIETLYYHAGCGRNPVGTIYPSSHPEEIIRTVRRPLGTVGVITPWNFPLQIAAWKVAPALLWGNTVVWKPSSETPAVAAVFVEILLAAGVHPEAIQLVLAPGRLGSALVEHSDINAVTFTGSVGVGHLIRDKVIPRGAKLQMELGGHNAAVVNEDADMELAAAAIVAGAMGSTGQKCTATRRIITVGGAAEKLIPHLKTELAKLRVGVGNDPQATIGPVVSARAAGEIKDSVKQAISEGAEVVAQNEIPTDSDAFVAPTILRGSPELTICSEEVFGPVTTVLEVGSIEEAVELANATEFGLTATIFTSQERAVRYFLDHMDAGLVKVNVPTTGSEVHGPFGGVKNSTYPGPREQNGDSAADFFTQTKTAYLRLVPEKE